MTSQVSPSLCTTLRSCEDESVSKGKAPLAEDNEGPSPDPGASGAASAQCIVCLSDLPADEAAANGEDVATLIPCSHTLHNDCLAPWIEKANSCPLCRTSFNVVNVSRVLRGGSYLFRSKLGR